METLKVEISEEVINEFLDNDNEISRDQVIEAMKMSLELMIHSITREYYFKNFFWGFLKNDQFQ